MSAAHQVRELESLMSATHNTLHCTATHQIPELESLMSTTHCSTLHCDARRHGPTRKRYVCNMLQHTCNTLDSRTRNSRVCNTLQHAALHCNTPDSRTRKTYVCNALQHTCNTPGSRARKSHVVGFGGRTC